MANPTEKQPVVECHGEEYQRLIAKARGYLPFLLVIIDSENLDIQNEHKVKLQSLYDMVDDQRLSTAKLKSCESVFCSLFTKYHKLLSDDQLRTLQNSQNNILSSNKGNHTIRSSGEKLILNENDQTPNNKSESPNKMFPLKVIEDKNLDKEKDGLESNEKLDKKKDGLHNDDKEIEESTLENKTSEAPICDKNSKDKSIPTVCKSIDNSKELANLLGVIICKLGDKLDKSDNNPAEIAKQLFYENPDVYNNILENINLDHNDMNRVKQAIASLNCSNGSESSLPLLPPQNDELSKSPPEPPQHAYLVPSKLTKDGERILSDKPVQKVVSSLKPGTLMDLENTKLISSSLHIESLRPVVKSNDSFKPVAITNVKSTNHLLTVENMFPCDPRQKTSPLKTKNSMKPNQTSVPINAVEMTTVPIVQNHDSKLNLSPIPMVMSSPPLPPPLLKVDCLLPPLPSSMSMVNNLFHPISQEKTPHCGENTIFSQHNTSHSALPGYNISSMPKNCPSSSMPVFKKLFNNRSPSTQDQYKHNHEFNYDSSNVGRDQNPYSYQPYVNNATSHSNNTQYRHSDSSNRQYDRFPVRDPRLGRNELSEPYYRSYREYRLAMQSKEKSFNEFSESEVCGPGYHSRTLEKDTSRNTEKTKSYVENKDFNNVETVVCDKAKSIKDFKIPKLKQKDEVCDKDKGFKIKVMDNIDRRSETLKNNSIDKYKKSKTIKNKTKKNGLIKDSCKKKFRETEIIKDRLDTGKHVMTDVTKNVKSEVRKSSGNSNDKIKDLKLDEITEKVSKVEESSTNIITKVNSTETRPKKLKKCSNEREFKKIVKEAVANSKDSDVHGPKTRNSLIKKDGTFKKYDSDTIKQSNNKQNPVLQEYNESSSNGLDGNQNTKNDVSNNLETSQNIISSTSKELSDADSSTEVVCNKRHKEKAANVKKKKQKKRQKLLMIMDYVEKEPGVSKNLINLLKGFIIDSDESESSEKSDDEEQPTIEKKNKDSSGEKSFGNEKRNEIISLDENNLNHGSVEDHTEEVESCTTNIIDNALNSDCSSECLSTSQVKSKSNKCINHQPHGNIAILKDNRKVELKDLKIVIKKYNKESDNVTGNICSSNIQPAQVSLQNQPDEITPVVSNSVFKTTVSEKKAKPKSKQRISSKSVKCNESCIPLGPKELPPIECDKTSETVSKEMQSTNQNATETAVTETNVSFESKTTKKPRARELDKLHAYTHDMYDANAIVNAPNVRHCRTNKQIDYVNTGLVIPKKINKSNELEFLCDHPSKKFDQNIEKPKSKKQVSKHSKPSTLKINTNRVLVQKPNTKTTVLKKSLNVLLPSQKNKSKSLKGKKNTQNKSQFNIILDKAPKMSPKILSEIDFTDKSYFQSGDILLECKFCHYSNTAINVVRHYKEKHCKEEVLLSRLSKNIAENLIKESLMENFGSLHLQDLKSTICRAPVNDLFTCVFCECVINDIVLYFDHLTSHTGEYRYKCKICEQVYSCENELEDHILEHSDYDKTDGISLLLYQNPNNKVFGYLCPFCYYVQINYDNVVKHMEMRHTVEDKKHNGNWTIVRVSLSLVNDESYKNSSIDYEYLVGCLPPALPPVDKIRISQLFKKAKMNLNRSDAKHVKPPNNKVMPDLSKKQVGSSSHENKSETWVKNFEFDYTLKGKCAMCSVAGLRCYLVNTGQLLMFKCCISMCLDSSFSTEHLKEFDEHIEQNHKNTVWDGKCSTCGLKLEKISEECLLVRDALKHLVNHHLVKKEVSEKSNMCLNKNSVKENNTSTKETPSKLLVRCVPLNLIVAHPSCAEMPENLYNPVVTNDGLSINEISSNLNPIGLSIKAEPICDDSLSVHETFNPPSISDDLFKEIPVIASNSLSISEEVPSALTSNDSSKESLVANYSNLAGSEEVPSALTSNNSTKGIPVIANSTLSVSEEVPSALTSNDSSKECPVDANNSLSVNEEVPRASTSNDSNKAYETGFIQSNYDGPIKIDTVISLREVKKKKVPCSKIIPPIINEAASINPKLNLPLSVSLELGKNYLKPGHYIVNKGKPIVGSCIYKLIDTTYKKGFGKQMKDFLSNSMKTRTAFTVMMKEPKLLGLFKCMDKSCTKIFNHKDLFIHHMKRHFSSAGKKNKVHIKNPEFFSKCAYCFRKFDDEVSLADHVAEQYTFCKFFCNYCFYRAYSATHVINHISQFHPENKMRVLELDHDERNDENEKEILKAVDYNEFVLPFVCSTGSCTFSCFLTEDFTNHLLHAHQTCDKYCCYLCNREGVVFFSLTPNKMVEHLRMHNIAVYQCMYCLFGTEHRNVIANHIANEHFEYEPIFLERTPLEESDDVNNIVNLSIKHIISPLENGALETINLPLGPTCEIVPQNSKTRDFERSDYITAAMLSTDIDKSDSASSENPILITIPPSSPSTDNESNVPEDIGNEFIILDDASKINEELEKIKVDSESELRNPPQNSNNDEIIIIDDEDTEETITNEVTKQNRLPKESNNELKKFKRLALPIIPLDHLFFCKSCNINFHNSESYIEHLNTCEYLKLNGHQCPFCFKTFKDNVQVTEHIMLHGPDRFSCFSCEFKTPSKRAIQHHMRVVHDIENLDFVPLMAENNDYDRDEFIVHEDLTKSKNNNIKTLYTCAVCKIVLHSYKDLDLHMTKFHLINQYELYVLSNPVLSNNYTQQYLVKPAASVESLEPSKQCGASAKRKRSSDHTNNRFKKKMFEEANTSIEIFSPDSIENIPTTHILKNPVGCALCSFTTKVRSNLICHLNGHTTGQKEIAKELKNPVPSMGKSEKMFDKTINLSASSYEASNVEKMKIDELNKKIIEVVVPPNSLLMNAYPKFVAKELRYKCPIFNACPTFITKNSDMLKTHIAILHSKFPKLGCPHCPKGLGDMNFNTLEHHLMLHGENLYGCQYCDYIDFNRAEMKVHMRTIHLQQVIKELQSSIIVIRQKMLEDYVLERSACQDQSSAAEWICNLCTSGINKYTLNEIKVHISAIHKMTKMYKCPLCLFEHDNNGKVFEDHYRIKHPTVAPQWCTLYEKVTNIEPNHQQNHVLSVPNLVEQALESIEPSIVPPTCRGIPLVSYNKSNNKSNNKSSKIKKDKLFVDNFDPNHSLGELTPNGLYSCPICNEYETDVSFQFRQHLYEEVHYKLWKCLSCSELSDSARKMAWHIKKHKNETRYQRIEFPNKLEWVDKVIKHQQIPNSIMLGDTNKKRCIKQRVPVSRKKSLTLSLKKKNDAKKSTLDLNTTISHESPTEIIETINLLDDSDDE